MSKDRVSAVAPEDRPPLAQPIIELRKSQQALSVLVNRLFEDLDVRRAQLDEQARQLRAERALLSRGGGDAASAKSPSGGTPAARIGGRLAQTEADLQAARSEIATYRERLSAALAAQGQSSESAAGADERLPRLDELEREREHLQSSLDAARVQISQLATAALDLADARDQIATLREQLLAARADASAATSEGDARHQQKIFELEYERRALRAELESVRRQAAELTENLAESRRQFVKERTEWSSELRHLRRLLERQGGFFDDPDSALGPALAAACIAKATDDEPPEPGAG